MNEMFERVTAIIHLMLPTSMSRQDARLIADNVFAGIREPTDSMITAAAEDSRDRGGYAAFADTWRAMIDDILTEPKL